MGATRAFVTVRRDDGATTYINNERLALQYLALIAGPISELQDDVEREVDGRLQAIRPVIEARLHGRNSCGAVRARRNVAEHNFSVNIDEVTLSGAAAVQRGQRPVNRAHSIKDPGEPDEPKRRMMFLSQQGTISTRVRTQRHRTIRGQAPTASCTRKAWKCPKICNKLSLVPRSGHT